MSGTGKTSWFIHGIGTAVPEQSVNAAQSALMLEPTCKNQRSARLLQRIAPLTGIEKRHVVALDFQHSKDGNEPLYRPAVEQPQGPGMSLRNALFQKASVPLITKAMSTFSPQQLSGVDALITATCTHASAPGLEQPILAHTPVPASAQRWNLGFMGCSAGLAGMRLVHRTGGPGLPALIVACELSSLHFQYTDELDQMTANLLFADGAAAMLLSGEPSRLEIKDGRCLTIPGFAHQMQWLAADHGLQLRLSAELPETIGQHLPKVVADFLRTHELSVRDVDHWVVHPGGPQILDCVERSLALPADALQLSRSILRRFGNMSSPTIFFIMKELFETNACGTCMAVAFGPGLTIELVLMQIHAAGTRHAGNE